MPNVDEMSTGLRAGGGDSVMSELLGPVYKRNVLVAETQFCPQTFETSTKHFKKRSTPRELRARRAESYLSVNHFNGRYITSFLRAYSSCQWFIRCATGHKVSAKLLLLQIINWHALTETTVVALN